MYSDTVIYICVFSAIYFILIDIYHFRFALDYYLYEYICKIIIYPKFSKLIPKSIYVLFTSYFTFI